jgi:DNA polymerase-3 subunit epsilon
VGHHVSFDVKMINERVKTDRFRKTQNRSIDTDRMYQKKFKELQQDQHAGFR